MNQLTGAIALTRRRVAAVRVDGDAAADAGEPRPELVPARHLSLRGRRRVDRHSGGRRRRLRRPVRRHERARARRRRPVPDPRGSKDERGRTRRRGRRVDPIVRPLGSSPNGCRPRVWRPRPWRTWPTQSTATRSCHVGSSGSASRRTHATRSPSSARRSRSRATTGRSSVPRGIGQDDAYVLQDILGCSADEFAALRAAGVVGGGAGPEA